MTTSANPEEAASQATGPKNAVVILLDSLNRHMLGAYGGTEFETPNLDRLAARSLRFNRHYAGSLPCMPARHDILCGALDFLWRPWGSIELWETPLTVQLREAGVTTMLVSDHPHLFEVGGENYHSDFNAWEYERGGESDPWKTRPDPSWLGAPEAGAPGRDNSVTRHYDVSKTYFQGEDDFPGPRTMAAAADWLDRHAPEHDQFFLFVDEFDPHEPFDTPEPYASMYDPDWEGPHLIWPPYIVGALQQGVLNEREAHQLRSAYGAKLTMIDEWLGHAERPRPPRPVGGHGGHPLHGSRALPGREGHLGQASLARVRTPRAHPALHLVARRRARHERCAHDSVDLHATLLDLFGVEVEHRTHGRSLLPLLRGEVDSTRDYALCGIWGREVHLIFDEFKYARAPEGDNAPLSVWSNRWSTMPGMARNLQLPPPDDRAWLDRMPGSKIPVIRQPFQQGDLLPYWAVGDFTGSHLYRLSEDPTEAENRVGERAEAEAADLLREALLEVEAPDDQIARLGLD